MIMDRTSQEKTRGKLIRCKAAVCWKPEEPLVIEEIDVEPPKAWEVRIKIICTSLCHTDVTFWKMRTGPGFFPRIFGHEGVGVVESVGENVREVEEGDTVIPTFMADCRECVDCKSEKSNICSNIAPSIIPGMPRDGGTTRFFSWKGEPLHSFFGVSSFSEYTVVDVAHITKIDSQIPPDKACLLGCGISTGVGAAWKVAGVEPGSKVAIFGLGTVGLAVTQGARIRGASQIIGIDLNPAKFEIGKKLGLTHFINPQNCGDKSLSQVVREMTDGGADYSFECIGLASIMNEAYKSSRKGWGKTIILGTEMNGSPLCIEPHEISIGRTIMGSLFGGIKAKTDIPQLVKHYLDKELHLDEFITHEISFEDINKAFDLLLSGKSLRCIIWMDK